MGRTDGGDEGEDELILDRLSLRCLTSRHLGSVSSRHRILEFKEEVPADLQLVIEICESTILDGI